MGVHALAAQRLAVLRCGADVDVEAAGDGVAAEPPAGPGREQRVGEIAAAFGDPDIEHILRGQRERNGPVLAALCRARNYVAVAA